MGAPLPGRAAARSDWAQLCAYGRFQRMVAVGPSVAGDQGDFWLHACTPDISLLQAGAGIRPYLDPADRSAQIDLSASDATLCQGIRSSSTQSPRRVGF